MVPSCYPSLLAWQRELCDGRIYMVTAARWYLFSEQQPLMMRPVWVCVREYSPIVALWRSSLRWLVIDAPCEWVGLWYNLGIDRVYPKPSGPIWLGECYYHITSRSSRVLCFNNSIVQWNSHFYLKNLRPNSYKPTLAIWLRKVIWTHSDFTQNK